MIYTKRQFLLTLPALASCFAPQLARAQAVDAEAVARHYAALVHASYAASLEGALALQARVRALVAAPDDTTLAAARTAWLAAREFYGQTEAFRFYGGPIDDDRGPEGRLNAWPLDESYIDSVEGSPDAGIVNDRRIAITKAALSRLNEREGEENIATGWHAIEFLLWGQDLYADGPGRRPASDFIDGRKPNAARRRQYLTVVTELLVDDLRYLVSAWAPQGRNYRERFERGGLESIRQIIVGIGSLSRGELAGERLEVALNTQDQEDEHSCFSDNTHRDIVANALGIENVWLGQFAGPGGQVLSGPSMRDLVEQADPALARRTTQHVEQSLAAARAIQPPFDREIIGDRNAPGRLRVQATIDSLVRQSRDFVDVAVALGIERLTLVQPK